MPRPLRAVSLLMMMIGAVLAVAAMAGPAVADDCTNLGGTLVPAVPPNECQISGVTTVKTGTFQLDETLHILNGGTLRVGFPGITINITANLLMDAGSKIDGNLSAQAHGADILVNATDDIVLRGAPLAGTPVGAIITANLNVGSCPTPSYRGGHITLNADSDHDVTGNLTLDPGTSTSNGSKVTSVSPCGRGEILITGVNVSIGGDVLSEGTTTVGRGGPITLNGSCNLTVADLGSVVSKGRDPGADLVHLQGGCVVTIFGLVASTGPGHTATSPPTKCSGTNRPDKPANTRACVEIWAGDDLLIDATSPHNGEVTADTGQSGGVEGISWIDLFAKRGEIVIRGDSSGGCQNIGLPTYTPCFAVHANQFLGDQGHGGIIRVKAIAGGVSMSGLALQASDTANGGRGGTITVEAKLDVDQTSGTIEAKGSTGGGGSQHGGVVNVRSFGTAGPPAIGSIATNGNSKIDVTGRTPADGVSTLTACATIGFPPGVIVPATIVPIKTVGMCDGAPDQPTYLATVALPCLCGGCPCVNTFRFVAGSPNRIRLDGDQLKALTEVRLTTTSCEPTAGTIAPFIGAKTDAQVFVNTSGVAPRNLPHPLDLREGLLLLGEYRHDPVAAQAGRGAASAASPPRFFFPHSHSRRRTQTDFGSSGNRVGGIPEPRTLALGSPQIRAANPGREEARRRYSGCERANSARCCEVSRDCPNGASLHITRFTQLPRTPLPSGTGPRADRRTEVVGGM